MSLLARVMAKKIATNINLKVSDEFQSIDHAISYYNNNSSLFAEGYAAKLVTELTKLKEVVNN